jgi:hypothetical protein
VDFMGFVGFGFSFFFGAGAFSFEKKSTKNSHTDEIDSS